MAGMLIRTAPGVSIFQRTYAVFTLLLASLVLFRVDKVSARGISPVPSDHSMYANFPSTTSRASPFVVSSTPLPPDRYIPGAEEAAILRQHLLKGLGLTRVPDVSKMNVSQEEYDRMFAVYLDRVELSRRRHHNASAWSESGADEEDDDEESWDANNPSTHVFSWNASRIASVAAWPTFLAEFRLLPHLPSFLVNLEGWVLQSAKIRVPSHWQSSSMTLSVQVNETTWVNKTTVPHKNSLQDSENGWTVDDQSQAISLDIPDLFQAWIGVQQQNTVSTLRPMEFQLRSDSVKVIQPQDDDVAVQLTLVYERRGSRVKRSRKSLDKALNAKKGRTDCNKQQRKNHNDAGGKNVKGSNSKNCCRHSMKVAFRDLEGFEFVLKPDYFDAYLCKGKCPSRFNPAHDHALLQSLLHAKNKKLAPRPCCAPSKLEGLEILHADENDHTKLTVTKWDNVIVTECACA